MPEDLSVSTPSGVILTADEVTACAWALDHLIERHDYDALRSRDGARVDLRDLLTKLTAR